MAFDTLDPTQAGKENLINELFDAISWGALFGIRRSASTGLTIILYGGRFNGSTLGNQTLTLPASSTSFVEADPATGTVASNTTGFTAGMIALAQAVTSATGVTSYVQEDRLFAAHTSRKVKSIAGGATVTLTAAEAACDILELTGAKTANLAVVVPNDVHQWTVFNNSTGAFTTTVKTAAGTGVAIGNGKRAILYSDGTNVVRVTADV